jgi:hypothetical protein
MMRAGSFARNSHACSQIDVVGAVPDEAAQLFAAQIEMGPIRWTGTRVS